MYIQSVKMGAINKNSGANNGYANFTNLSTDLVKGSTPTIKLTPGFSVDAYDTSWKAWIVWIDYNGDGDFTDAGEKVAVDWTTGNSSVAMSFKVPTTAKTGKIRMRVAMSFDNDYDNYLSPCGTLIFGEYEDYTVNITN